MTQKQKRKHKKSSKKAGTKVVYSPEQLPQRKDLVGLYGGYPHTVLTERAKNISDSGYMVISNAAFKKRRAFSGY